MSRSCPSFVRHQAEQGRLLTLLRAQRKWMQPLDDVTKLLVDWRNGDEKALEKLMHVVIFGVPT